MPTLRRVKISPEYSAQRRSHPPNPALQPALAAAATMSGVRGKWGLLGDLGCGKLRHFNILSPLSKSLVLIETRAQLEATQSDQGETFTIPEVAKTASRKGRHTTAIGCEEFAAARLELDLIVCIAVLDVVPRATRRELLHAAARNLKLDGLFIVIVPRNDSTIVQRCTEANAYLDGHIFAHHGTNTFFHNFRDHRPIITDANHSGLVLLKDLSRYRQVALILGHKPDSR